jgi:hypothetical protein
MNEQIEGNGCNPYCLLFQLKFVYNNVCIERMVSIITNGWVPSLEDEGLDLAGLIHGRPSCHGLGMVRSDLHESALRLELPSERREIERETDSRGLGFDGKLKRQPAI